MIRIVGAAVLVLAGIGVAAGTIRSFLRRRRERRDGVLLSVDREEAHGPSLTSEEHRLVGRPDAIRRLADGRRIPVEIKHRATPREGPPRSHRVQIAAYSLLVESTWGRSPPYGVLRYSDGGEFRIPWDAQARRELLQLRASIARPYRGEATPSPGRCARCPWRHGCDARYRP